MDEYQEAPFAMITGTLHQVSTLFRSVGFPNIPFSVSLGGRRRGLPVFPSIDAARAVYSPHTNGPAPVAI